ncbi:MAG: hypothetical protein JJT85_11515 [Chromatiales bacterium]|nr:hypothetical protein [Chromatiales bacterium]
MRHFILFALLGLAVPALSADPMREALEQLQLLGQPGAGPVELPEVIELNERDVTSFIAAARELEALDLPIDDGDGDIPDMADMLEANPEAQRIISRHGFTIERMSAVSYSLAMAVAAVQMEEDGEELARARAEAEAALAEMRASMPPEAFAMFERQMGSMGGVLDQLTDQPAGNKALARRYMDELEQLFEFDDEDY